MNDSLNNSSPGFDQSSPRWLEILTAIWLICLLVFGVIINSCALAIVARSRLLSRSNSVLIATLLVNNIGMSVLAFPLSSVAEITRGWYVNLTDVMCTYYATVVYLFGLCNMFILTAISVTRYFVITHFSTVGKSITVKVTIWIVVLCYSGALALTLAPLLGLGSYGLEEHQTSCGLAWNDRSIESKSYLLLILFATFVIPVLVMIFCYGSIYHTVNKSAIATEMQTTRRFIAQRKRETHLLKMCLAMVVAFILSWTPYTVVSFYQAFGPGTRLSPIITRIPAIVAKTAVLWDPIIYALCNGECCLQVLNLFGLARSGTTDQEDSNISNHRSSGSISVIPPERPPTELDQPLTC